jgi:hypothetical protein
MKREQIIKAASTMNAKDFLDLADANGLAPTILDQDNIQDPNDGYLNVIVNGLARGEALLFVDGEFCGL